MGHDQVKIADRLPPVRIHSGFYNAWREIAPQLEQYLIESGVTRMTDQKLSKDNVCHEVLIGGHSLGGAIAIIGGAELLFKGYHVLGIYTFGQPKAFGPEIRAGGWNDYRIFADIQRFVIGGDIVPSLPPGYAHFGEERYSKQIGEVLKQSRGDWYWPSIGDHSMRNYLRLISALVVRDEAPEATGIRLWLQDRSAPLASYLGTSPREAVKIAGAWSGRGSSNSFPCARRVAGRE